MTMRIIRFAIERRLQPAHIPDCVAVACRCLSPKSRIELRLAHKVGCRGRVLRGFGDHEKSLCAGNGLGVAENHERPTPAKRQDRGGIA